MRHRWAALVFVLALSVFMPRDARAQQAADTGQASGRRAGMKLGQNFPNPFNPETRIPFSIGNTPDCADAGRQYRVSLRVYNVLAQQVAIPLLQGGTSDVAGRPIENMMLTCGDYTAYWDGKYLNTQREVASGIYLYRLEVDGRAVVKKMIVMK